MPERTLIRQVALRQPRQGDAARLPGISRSSATAVHQYEIRHTGIGCSTFILGAGAMAGRRSRARSAAGARPTSERLRARSRRQLRVSGFVPWAACPPACCSTVAEHSWRPNATATSADHQQRAPAGRTTAHLDVIAPPTSEKRGGRPAASVGSCRVVGRRTSTGRHRISVRAARCRRSACRLAVHCLLRFGGIGEFRRGRLIDRGVECRTAVLVVIAGQ